MSQQGWIKLHRKIKDNPLWEAETFTKGQAWVDLLLMVNHEKGSFFVRGNKITVNPGQTAVSQKTLSERWKWSRSKVARFLKLLKNEHQIEHQESSLTTIITVLNWTEHQKSDIKTNIKRTSNGHQTDTNKNEENDNNEKNYIIPTHKDVLEFFQSNNFIKCPDNFFDFWENKNWKRKNSPVKDWKATARNYEKSDKSPIAKTNPDLKLLHFAWEYNFGIDDSFEAARRWISKEIKTHDLKFLVLAIKVYKNSLKEQEKDFSYSFKNFWAGKYFTRHYERALEIYPENKIAMDSHFEEIRSQANV